MKFTIRHPYHLLDVSPWPLFMSLALLSFALGMVSWLGQYHTNLAPQLVVVALIAILWWRDVLRESKGGFHTILVQRGLMIGFLLFLVSEIMLFVSFFWAMLNSSLSPNVELGCQWPPVGVDAVNPWSVPLLGSCVLLASGFILTVGHHAIVAGGKDTAILSFLFTVLLGALFLVIQVTEYYYTSFTIADSVFGSTFFMATGLHGLHVFAGVTFLFVCLVRLFFDGFTSEHHNAAIYAIWYWHLVDVVWLFLYLVFYVWGGDLGVEAVA